MLNKFYLLGLVIVCISAKAQNISGSYQPMADGQVKKQQVEYVPTAESSPNGYENNLQHVVYDQPELLLHTPLTYGDRRDGYFHGTSAYGEKLFLLNVNGQVNSMAISL